MKYQNIFLLIFAGLLFPLVCSANVAMGFIVNYTPAFIFLVFLGICVIEAEVIKKVLWSINKRAFFIAVVVNLITSIIGLAAGNAVYGQIGGDPLFYIFGVAFVFSFLIEAVFLRLFFKKTSWRQLFKASFIMNIASYVFIAVFIVLDIFIVFTPIFAFFFIYKLFRFLVPEKKFKKAIFVIISVILAAGFTLFVSSFIPRYGVARDSRIISATSQARIIMSSVHANDGSYDAFNCRNQDMIVLCEEIEKHYEGGDFDIPIIAKTIDGTCIYSPLNRTEEKRLGLKKIHFWYCADSKGYVGSTSIDPGGQGYCVDGQSAVCPPVED